MAIKKTEVPAEVESEAKEEKKASKRRVSKKKASDANNNPTVSVSEVMEEPEDGLEEQFNDAAYLIESLTISEDKVDENVNPEIVESEDKSEKGVTIKTIKAVGVDLSEEALAKAKDVDENGLSGRQVTTQGSGARKMGNVSYSMSENYSRIVNLQKNRNLCDSIVSGVFRKNNKEFETDCVMVNYLGFPIYITIDDFLTDDEVARIARVSSSAAMQLPNYNKAKYEREEKLKVAKKTVGAHIMFTISDVTAVIDTNTRTITGEPVYRYRITGSRVAAMKVLQHKHFFAPSAQNRPLIKGDIVECNVLRTHRNHVTVSCCGVNVLIHRSQLFVTRWCDPMEDFVPGMKFDAVLSEDPDIDFVKKKVSLRLTRIPLDADMADFYLRQFSPENTDSGLIGTIAYIATDEYNAPRFYGINLEAINLRGLVSVKTNNYQNMRLGDEVVFHCTHVDEKDRMFIGYCEPLNISKRNNW